MNTSSVSRRSFLTTANKVLLYCNGDYDETIIRELDMETDGRRTTANAWTAWTDIWHGLRYKYLYTQGIDDSLLKATIPVRIHSSNGF
jgi:hypothetical protein